MAKKFLTSDELVLMQNWFKFIFFPMVRDDYAT